MRSRHRQFPRPAVTALRLENTAALSALAQANTGSVPKIASRCAVFAKTDLAHAQQEGYLLEEICDGLCHGLAKNVLDVLFSGQSPIGPVLLTGGVARNQAVVGHIRDLTDLELIVAEFPCEAAGAALCLLGRQDRVQLSKPLRAKDIIISQSFEKQLCHAPIELKRSDYPDFSRHHAYTETCWDAVNPVEVDVYEDLEPLAGQGFYLGIDIGSTSTKAVLMTANRRIVTGFYTRTAGRPVNATQNIMAAIDRLLQKRNAGIDIIGVATTGSGRKFAGNIVGADLIIDEITAHAKAAVALDPMVDTIIEIGGQDAKFTTLQSGRVTFSAMNAVCAAGTGSFIEEQAQKLGCPLDRITSLTEQRQSPLASDRCTVFMERDINHYLSTGYSVNEAMAAVLHSVVENYLSKVAIESSIGTTINFQGATAKIKSLLAERKKAFRTTLPKISRRGPTIGIPAGLHLLEDLPVWCRFFADLGIRTVTSARLNDAVKTGKPLAGAEFCAPMTALFGHVDSLLSQCDFLFVPFYLEQKSSHKSVRRQYCYYTQFAPGLVSNLEAARTEGRILTPLVHYLYNTLFTKVQLHRMLNTHMHQSIGFLDISAAYDAAVKFKQTAINRLKKAYRRHLKESNEFHAIVLGRPYTVLVPSMNKGILDIFAKLGVKTFYQDMLTYSPKDIAAIKPLLNEIHWHYATQTLQAAEVVARTDSAYPVLVTSFKCTPDSFIIDYFKKVMAAHDKPYLILQLDEHDSSVGYETRIEAAIGAFKSHYAMRVQKCVPGYAPSLVPSRAEKIKDKTLLFPNWDPTCQRLVVANLQKEGFDARLLSGSETLIRKSMRFNNGQCTPLTIIAQEYIDYIESHDLDPERTLLWIGISKIACNIGLFAHQIQNILYTYGNGMQKAGVYAGRLSLADISMKLPVNTYLGFMFGGLLKKMGCRIRPYEKVAGTTDRALRKSLTLLEGAFRFGRSKEEVLAQVIEWFESIEMCPDKRSRSRPKVAIFGDLYIRDSELNNQDLIHFIEAHGGEVVTTPYSAYVKMIAQPYLRKWFVEGSYVQALSSKALIATITRLEKIYYKYFQHILKEPEPVYDESPQQILDMYNIRIENSGESMENILKIYYLKKYHPDIALFVQTSPAFCCPSLITQAMANRIERNTHTPIVSITYDGTGGNKNEVITPYLVFPRKELLAEPFEVRRSLLHKIK